MIDIKRIRENPDEYRKNLKRRKNDEYMEWLDKLLKKDEKWRKKTYELEQLKHKKNSITNEIRELKKQGKDSASKIKEMKEIPKKVKDLQQDVEKLQERIRFYSMGLPNYMHESVPYGKDDSENKEERKCGKLPKKDFKLISHGELAENLGIADFEKAAEVSGGGFHYLLGDLALLNMAIANYAIDFMTKKGYKLAIPPLGLRRKAYEGTVDLSDFENVMYKVEDEDLYLIATAEHPIAAFFMGETIKPEDLPVKMVGFSPCFRKEIGSHGVDTKGIFRVHQFWKVEQFIFCKPEDSWKFHEELIKNSEDMFKELELPYRIVNICTGDLGTIAAKKYDLEVWMAKQQKYREACSCSNCTDYQARRLNIRYGTAGIPNNPLVHTLNNTAIATSRAMVAMLENNQNKDGTVDIPKALQKYMAGKKKIEKQ